ncbi:ABC-type nitrate/sulfonate/bicarbonate transportsystem, ATPase component [Halalkaliarchaeum sp. AArc-CO]|uniref:ABC transporter ATP-binding protein n=1 Tax=unclassified Halalkaliarchaeum TaxID=2678344 RepID=UPI00217E9F8A|nr:MULTISPECIES: ABC transporter ATP-binding protein [unclassified Halalkaliarchaeum]MDR5673486.1 ABC transporter ATP-binding protein [Halalkaliarchaeum sp. AArc-GB]UWG49836.1 ABC-type nitrate/sulfonate/bicarbonate transportsystem, ATPase component [Halalkaliarchaeum sp. AArc-CO]
MTTDSGGRVEIEGLTKVYGGDEERVVAVDELDLEIEPGEFLTVLGPSGCGKSTLLDCVAGHVEPTSGRVLVDGDPVSGPDPERGVVFQENRLFPWKTVRQNVAFGPKMRDRPTDHVADLLDRMGLSEFADSYPNQLSGGMAQRAELARLLANEPSIMLMDEPFSALDAMTKGRMQIELLSAWRETDATALFVTHDVEEAILLADRVVVMTARPGTVKTVVDVPLSRPRDHDSRTTETFTELKRELLASIHGEAGAEFDGDDRSATETSSAESDGIAGGTSR